MQFLIGEKELHWHRYAGINIPITPYGVQTSSTLKPLDGSLNTNQVYGEVFTLNIQAGSGMKLTCEGSGGTSDAPEFTIDPKILVRADGRGSVKFALKKPAAQLNTYYDEIKFLEPFCLPNLPGYAIESGNHAVTFKLDPDRAVNLGMGAFFIGPDVAIEVQKKEWIGLMGSNWTINVPQEFDFTGNGRSLKLPAILVNISRAGVHGVFRGTLDTWGNVGNWKFWLNDLLIEAKGRELVGIIGGKVRLPIFVQDFEFNAQKMRIGEDITTLNIDVKTTDAQRLPLWANNTRIQLDTTSRVRATVREIAGEGRRFMPDADLSGVFTLQIDQLDFNEKLVGDKSIIRNRLKAIFPEAEQNFYVDLTDLRIDHLRIDPFKPVLERYKIDKFTLPANALKINGVRANLADFRIRSREAKDGSPEELNLEFVVKKGTELVQFTFVSVLNNDGNFEFNRIEVKLDNIECRCYGRGRKTKNQR